jgi:short-subunit dehydrogenase
MSMLHLARRTAPAMIEAGSGAIVASGKTSALRGKSNFSGFAPTKAAQRILAESMARELGPKGIHVAYILIDAVSTSNGHEPCARTLRTTSSSSHRTLPKSRSFAARAAAIERFSILG